MSHTGPPPINLLVLSVRADLFASVWRKIIARHVNVEIAHTQKEVFEALTRLRPDALLVDGFTDRPVTHRFIDRIRTSSPYLGIIGIVPQRRWDLRNELDALVSEQFGENDLLKAITSAKQKRSILQVGHFRLDLASRYLWVHRSTYHLAPKECQVFEIFMRNPGKLITSEQLMQDVWNYQDEAARRSVQVHIHWLRQKIEADSSVPTHLVTMRGKGYAFYPHP